MRAVITVTSKTVSGEGWPLMTKDCRANHRIGRDPGVILGTGFGPPKMTAMDRDRWRALCSYHHLEETVSHEMQIDRQKYCRHKERYHEYNGWYKD